MKPTLLEQLIDKPQREVAGSDSASRFDYQKSWALCEMIDRHIAGKNYLVAFEFHDDVVFFDSHPEPSTVEFFQVKTQKAPTKTIGSLTYKKKSEANSVLGKMCLNFEGIGSELEVSVSIVSNIPYQFSAASVCMVDVGVTPLDKLRKKLETEFGAWDKSKESRIYFRVFSVGIENIDDCVRGRAVNLFASEFGPNYTASVMGWLELIRSEVQRKNNYLSANVTNVAELISNKCVAREFVQATLTLVQNSHQPPIDPTAMIAELQKAGWTFQNAQRVAKQLSVALADYQNPNDYQCRQLVSAINEAYDADPATAASLSHALDVAVSALLHIKLPMPYTDKPYQEAIAMLVWHERL